MTANSTAEMTSIVVLLGTRGAAALCQGTLPGLPGPRSRGLAIHQSIRARYVAFGAGGSGARASARAPDAVAVERSGAKPNGAPAGRAAGELMP
jgi:hypothetical protein